MIATKTPVASRKRHCSTFGCPSDHVAILQPDTTCYLPTVETCQKPNNALDMPYCPYLFVPCMPFTATYSLAHALACKPQEFDMWQLPGARLSVPGSAELVWAHISNKFVSYPSRNIVPSARVCATDTCHG
ncbi:hypothetical protein GMOD_00008452 [Pyrenophora seminiperda CCB06]|uniref:Uncharacterized protein n=1 Tax=Pyrenophora seminiperda CCB06 TaxID=1302712 RepID=A0A3M7M8U3_9PLEO|nr:hypothetical protein GMOD_00008452 [Pyrenophora seminiperda CCB06]